MRTESEPNPGLYVSTHVRSYYSIVRSWQLTAVAEKNTYRLRGKEEEEEEEEELSTDGSSWS